jgi:hypothetical protein
MNSGANSVIVAGESIIASNIQESLISGRKNRACKVCSGSIIGGCCNTIYSCSKFGIASLNCISYNSAIIGGKYNSLSITSCDSGMILSGYTNMVFSYYSAIIGSKAEYSNGLTHSSYIWSSTQSSIISSAYSGLTGSCGGSIIGSVCANIDTSVNSSIISSSQSLIENSERSSIIGGYGMTLSSENDVVYVSSLKIDTVTASIDPSKVLTWDPDNYVRWTTSVSSPPALPVPKIHLNESSQLIDVFSYSTNGIHDTQAILHSYPTLINLDFTSDHFANPNNRIFIEMAMFKRKSNKKKGIIITRSASKWVVPSKHIAGVGQDTNLPWLSTGNFWSRGGDHSVYNFNTNTTQILGIDRPNHYEVYGYTVSNYPIWQYFTGRFEYADVLYRDSSVFDPNNATTSLSTINTLIPISGKRSSGKFKLTTRYSYSSMYTPVYCAFRYIQYFPNANGGKGQILSGPFSKTLKITGLYHPFNADYLTSAQVGYPVANISGDWLGIGFRSLKCYWESNLP